MITTEPLAYPAEYYYPEFIESRPDDPKKPLPLTHLPLTTSIDNGYGSTTKAPENIEYPTGITNKKKPTNKKQSSTSLALDVVTDQGLPDYDITQSVRTDPKRNLLRDPVERNIPRLIVDDSVIKQAVRTPRIVTTNLDDDYLNETTKSKQINNQSKSLANGHINRDLTKKNKGQTKPLESYRPHTVKVVEDEQEQQQQQQQQYIDDYWKKQVLIDDEGVVSIEPVKYDRNTYEGPFGLTRQGSFIFYIGLGVFTLLAAISLIMCGVFYGQSYPDSTSNSGKLAGIGVSALAFYLGLQLILVGLWHQKHRQENPKTTVKKSHMNNDTSHLKSSMEDEQYDYPYQQHMDYSYQQPHTDYTAYGNYPNPPYVSNVNEQMLLQQPGAATGAAYYEPVAWPSNVEVETQPDPKFLQPMDWFYGGQQPGNEIPLTGAFAPVPVAATDNKPEKKGHRHRHHDKKTVESEPPKAKFDNLFPNSTVTETALPVLNKAPETAELMKTIADTERNAKKTSKNDSSTARNSNRIKPVDGGADVSSVNDHHSHQRHRHHQPQRRHHRQTRHHSRHSNSSCSTCSSRSREEFHSDIGFNYHPHHHHFQHKHSEPPPKLITPRPRRARTLSQARTPSPPRTHKTTYRDTGIGTGLETRIMRDSSITADLEDAPNVRDNRLEQIPVIRRTIIVEPYPAQPSSQIVVKPRTDMIGKVRLGKNQNLTDDNETIIYPSSAFMIKNSKEKKKTPRIHNENIVEDLQSEDVNDDYEYLDEKSKKKNSTKNSSRKTVKNAFYD